MAQKMEKINKELARKVTTTHNLKKYTPYRKKRNFFSLFLE